MFANWLLVISMSPYLETKYGAWRVAILWFISCLGGQLTSAIGEDKCKMVVGASGGVFGLVGLFVADMAINFRTIKRPILRCILILVVMSFCMAEMKVKCS